MSIAFFIGYSHLGAAWDLVEELPQSFQDKSAKAALWARESIQVLQMRRVPGRPVGGAKNS